MNCKHCPEKPELVIVQADEPWHDEHYQCPNCDSTYPIWEEQKPDIWSHLIEDQGHDQGLVVSDKHSKEVLIQIIERRILSEHRKHSHSLPNEWAKIAAHKILASILEIKK